MATQQAWRIETRHQGLLSSGAPAESRVGKKLRSLVFPLPALNLAGAKDSYAARA